MPDRAQYLPEISGKHAIDLPIDECQACGVLQVSGPPVHYYRESIRASGLSKEMREFRRDQLAGWVWRYGLLEKRVLEVGCGRGEYLEVLAEVGTDAVGIEWNEAAVAACRGRGLNVHRGYLGPNCFTYAAPLGIGWQDGIILGAPFSAFASFSFLEHCPWPTEQLSAIRDRLAPGAVGLIEVPNFDVIFEEGMVSEFMLDHLTYFTADTLRSFLSTNGFTVLEMSVVWHKYILSAVVRKREPMNLRHMMDRVVMIGKQMDEFMVGAKRRAVWGAGHQSLAMLAITGVGERIDYVVDSSPEKQWRYTPATNVPIRGPEALEKEPVDALIVACAGYSDEVAAKAREINPAMRIAILRPEGLVT